MDKIYLLAIILFGLTIIFNLIKIKNIEVKLKMTQLVLERLTEKLDNK